MRVPDQPPFLSDSRSCCTECSRQRLPVGVSPILQHPRPRLHRAQAESAAQGRALPSPRPWHKDSILSGTQWMPIPRLNVSSASRRLVHKVSDSGTYQQGYFLECPCSVWSISACLRRLCRFSSASSIRTGCRRFGEMPGAARARRSAGPLWLDRVSLDLHCRFVRLLAGCTASRLLTHS